MKIDDIYEVLINEHDINGNGITRINSFVVFVKNGLKDELIKIKIINNLILKMKLNNKSK